MLEYSFKFIFFSVILEEGKRWPPDKLIACRYIRQNVPINQQAVIDFVIPKNLLL